MLAPPNSVFGIFFVPNNGGQKGTAKMGKKKVNG
jgi:hypothetical protein